VVPTGEVEVVVEVVADAEPESDDAESVETTVVLVVVADEALADCD
jgi:hypothetical protein